MYAVIETGGKQYRVAPGDVVEVELTGTDGDAIEFGRVLMVAGDGGVEVGRPTVEGAKVSASLVGAVRGPKIRVFKMKKRKQYRRTQGHRQNLLRIRIDDILVPGRGRTKSESAS
jgi:large subunit ribosomal protein L21